VLRQRETALLGAHGVRAFAGKFSQLVTGLDVPVQVVAGTADEGVEAGAAEYRVVAGAAARTLGKAAG